VALPRGFTASARRLARNSRFVFSGVVDGSRRSSLSILPGGPGTIVTRVEDIHLAGPELRNQRDRLVTIVVTDEAPDDGDRFVFFTDPIMFGETMAVHEVGRIRQPDDAEALTRLMEQTEIEMADEQLKDHIASTEAVVEGKVRSTRDLSTVSAETKGEHDPDWWAARIRVARSLKGDAGTDLDVRFPTSRDRRWFEVPRLRQGDEGLFLLHRDGEEHEGIHLALLHPDDFIPSDDDRAKDVRRHV
jgi:hypothetical protein